MGILESIVVVYLRRLYYPHGFGFPLVAMDPAILRVEVIREAMTLIMLAAVAGLAASDPWGRLMAFLLAFGSWDLAYYAGLRWFLHWPAGLLTPDILFLIPTLWIGPVLAPVLVSLACVATGLLLGRIGFREIRSQWLSWGPGVLACGIIFLAFILPGGDPARPRFSWPLFGSGYLLGGFAFVRLARHARRIR